MKKTSIRLGIIILVSMMGLELAIAGTLAPPDEAFDGSGQPVVSMKSIDEIEPRKAILSLPYVITNSGAYYLAGSLNGGSNDVGIQIECSDVQLDLRGFALVGAPGSKDGIRIVGTNENITIRNGSIREWDEFGVNGPDSDDGSLVDIKANRNGFGGLVYGDGAMISQCSVFGNGYKAPLPPMYTEPTIPDSDYDGMDDYFEQQIVDADTTDAIHSIEDVHPNDDFDGDLVDNFTEFTLGTSPIDNTSADGDNDGMPDDFEYMIIDFSPVDAYSNILDVIGSEDFDGDTANNMDEFMAFTDPTNAMSYDLDLDGLNDPFELIILGHDATNAQMYTVIDDIEGHQDYDSDGASNWAEHEAKTNPTDPDSKPATSGDQSEYANYTEPPEGPMYDDFEDPMDEPADDGIRVGGDSTVKESKARGNRGSGIYAKYGSRVVSCTVAGNLVDGIHLTDYGTILDCTSARNKKDGITVGSKCRVKSNNCGQNGDFQMMNQQMPEGAGIRILGNGNRIEDNNVCGNALGIEVDDSYSMQYGGMAGMSGGGNLIIGNSSVDNWGKAFDLSGGDFMGGEMYTGDITDPQDATNAMIDANNPFSNFSY